MRPRERLCHRREHVRIGLLSQRCRPRMKSLSKRAAWAGSVDTLEWVDAVWPGSAGDDAVFCAAIEGSHTTVLDWLVVRHPWMLQQQWFLRHCDMAAYFACAPLLSCDGFATKSTNGLICLSVGSNKARRPPLQLGRIWKTRNGNHPAAARRNSRRIGPAHRQPLGGRHDERSDLGRNCRPCSGCRGAHLAPTGQTMPEDTRLRCD